MKVFLLRRSRYSTEIGVGVFYSFEAAQRGALADQERRRKDSAWGETSLRLENRIQVGNSRFSPMTSLLGTAYVSEISKDLLFYFVDEFEIQGSPLEALAECAESGESN